MIDDKLGRISIGLETEFFSDEAKLDIRLVSIDELVKKLIDTYHGLENSRFANIAQCSKPFSNDKHVHEIRAHVRGIQVELEEPMIVSQRQR
jgi:hypothetical protein